MSYLKKHRWGWILFSFIVLPFYLSNAQSGINLIGSFESELPSYWKKGGEPSGAKLEWATDQYRSMGRSLKIEKTGTGEEAYWESENMCDLWSPTHSKDVDIFLGAYVRTEGINVNPANDEERWWISYTFYGESGSLIGEIKLPIDQSKSSSEGWVADTNEVGSVILPEDSYTTVIKFVGGKNATGTVWADDFMFYGRNGAWAGQDWNTQLGVPTGWFYWLPPIGGNDGRLSDGYENTKITDEESYHGRYSLKFENLPGTHDGFVGTVRYPIGENNEPSGKLTQHIYDITALKDVNAGDMIRISVWLKATGLNPQEMAEVGDQASFAITPIFHNTSGNNEGWGEFWSKDIPCKFPVASEFGWMQFYVDVPVQEGAKSLSVRLHPLGRFKGTVYCDLLEVRKLDLVGVETEEAVPNKFDLFQNYPNPFNPTTIISYSLPKEGIVTLKIYDILGREIKTLINSAQSAGVHKVTWDGTNNYGVKVSAGAYIYRFETEGFTSAKKMLLLK